MRELEDFFPYVQPFAVACPEPVALKYILESAIEFCERTRIWREVETIPVTGQEFEVMCVPPHSSLYQIERAWIDETELVPAQFKDVAHLADFSGLPKFITQASQNSVSLYPRGKGNLKISMFLKPAYGAEVLPDFLFDQHATAIGYGALKEICLLPNQPFTSPDYAMMFAQRFDAACNRHFATNIKGQHRARARTRPNFF